MSIPSLSSGRSLKKNLKKHSLKALAAVSLITALQAPVYADLETVVKSLPADASVAFTVDLRPENWAFLFKQPEVREWLMSGEFQEVGEEIKEELGLEPMELLQSLGSHGAFAVYQNPENEEEPVFLISIELSNPKLAESLMARFKKLSDDPEALPEEVTFETYKETEIAITDVDSQPVAFAYRGKTLLISNQLEQMHKALDLDGKNTGLLNNPRFKPVYDNLGKEQFVAWVDMENLKLPEEMVNELRSELGSAGSAGLAPYGLDYGSSFGVGMKLNEHGLAIKNVMGFKKNGLTGSQTAFLAKLTARPGLGLDPMLALTPEKPLFTGASGTFNLTFENPVLSGEHREGDAKVLDQAVQEILKGVSEGTGLDLKRDIMAQTDGRVGVSAFYLERFPAYDSLPHIVTMMGVKDGKSFLATLHQKLRISDPDSAPETTAAAKPIMLSREPVESYKGVAFYGFEGSPEDLASMKQEFGDIDPTVMMLDNVFVMGSSRSGLRAVVDHAQKIRTSLLDDPEFQATRSHMTGKDEQNLFYADLTRWYRIADHFLHNEAEFRAGRQLFSQFKSLAADGSVTADGTRGNFIVNADLDKVDFTKLAADMKVVETEQKVTAVEENMRNFKGMVELYREQNKGQLPKNVAQLMKHAEANGYSYSLAGNPFGIDAKPALGGNLLDYHTWKAYKPTPALAGVVVMESTGGKQPMVKIYGTNDQGDLIKHQGNVFMFEVK